MPDVEAKEIGYEIVPDKQYRELEEKLKQTMQEAEAIRTEHRHLHEHVGSFTGAGLNHARHNGQIVVFLSGRPFYLSGNEARTLMASLQGVLDGLPNRFFTDYGEGSTTV